MASPVHAVAAVGEEVLSRDHICAAAQRARCALAILPHCRRARVPSNALHNGERPSPHTSHLHRALATLCTTRSMSAGA
jgi:hypothetical protein